MVEVEGLPLRVVRSGSGPSLLLINGIGAPVEMWAPLVARLDGRELVAFDLPGAGASRPPPRPLRMAAIARIVTRLLDTLGYGRIDVLGYSFGGVVAQELAWRSPHRVGRLVLCATSVGVGSVPPEPLAGLMMLTPARYYSRWAAARIVPLIAGGRTRRDPVVLNDDLALRVANPPSARGYLYQLYAVTGWSSKAWLHRVHHPTLILHGDDDPLVPVVNARRMAAIMPDARLMVVSGGGHMLLLDQPGSVVMEIGAFLGSPAAG